VCMLVVDTLNACSDMNVHLYDSPAHFMKLSMQCDACDSYFVVNIKRRICVHMHFRLFDFHKVVWQQSLGEVGEFHTATCIVHFKI